MTFAYSTYNAIWFPFSCFDFVVPIDPSFSDLVVKALRQSAFRDLIFPDHLYYLKPGCFDCWHHDPNYLAYCYLLLAWYKILSV